MLFIFWVGRETKLLSNYEYLVQLAASRLASTARNVKDGALTSQFDHLRYMCINRFFHLREEGLGKMEASQQACLVMYPGSKDYHSRLIRTWAAY